MGKWAMLKGVVPPIPPDLDYQRKVDFVKNEKYAGQSKADIGREYLALRAEKEELEARIKELNIGIEATSQLMIHEMEGHGENSFRLDTGETLAIKDEPYCSVEDKDAFNAWVHESGQEGLFSVHYQTLSALTKDRMINGQNPPPGIKVFLKQSITRYKARS